MSGLLGKLFNKEVQGAVNAAGQVLDQFITTDAEKGNAKQAITNVIMDALHKVLSLQAQILQTEMKGNWLQRSWRPIVMLTFVALLVIRFLGITEHHIDVRLELELLQIIKIGLGGYVAGRSIEKTAEIVTKNIDLPFLKKKDRKLYP